MKRTRHDTSWRFAAHASSAATRRSSSSVTTGTSGRWRMHDCSSKDKGGSRSTGSHSRREEKRMGKLHIFKPGEPVEVIERSTSPSLREMQALIGGGYIEVVDV